MNSETGLNAPDVHIAVISGGTATNALVPLLTALTRRVTFILPVSDNGGSTSELIRVVGGPAIGDLRSRITRLIPEEEEALRRLLSYRLPENPTRAKAEWSDIVEGVHPLWKDVAQQLKEVIRAFFIHVHVELLKRSRPQREFRFELASVGNLFFTGARLFCGSLDSAIELFLRVVRIPRRIQVLPCLNTNFTHHISALLENGTVITGQSQISHPSAGMHPSEPRLARTVLTRALGSPQSAIVHGIPSDVYGSSLVRQTRPSTPHLSATEMEDATPPYTHPDLRISQLHFSRAAGRVPLTAPVRRIFYISPYGQEIHPRAHSRVIETLAECDVVLYSIGSLLTSMVPVIILQGVGAAIAQYVEAERAGVEAEAEAEGKAEAEAEGKAEAEAEGKAEAEAESSETVRSDQHKRTRKRKLKVLLLNGGLDRETATLDATGFVRTIVDAALYSMYGSVNSADAEPTETAGISETAETAESSANVSVSTPYGRQSRTASTVVVQDTYTSIRTAAETRAADERIERKAEEVDWRDYVTHVLFIDPTSVDSVVGVRVNRSELEARGIVCVPVRGVQAKGETDGSDEPVLHYDLEDLREKLGELVSGLQDRNWDGEMNAESGKRTTA